MVVRSNKESQGKAKSTKWKVWMYVKSTILAAHLMTSMPVYAVTNTEDTDSRIQVSQVQETSTEGQDEPTVNSDQTLEGSETVSEEGSATEDEGSPNEEGLTEGDGVTEGEGMRIKEPFIDSESLPQIELRMEEIMPVEGSLFLGEATAKPGDIVNIPVQFNSNGSVYGVDFDVTFEQKYLELQSITEGDLIGEGMFDWQKLANGDVRVIVANSSNTPISDADGTLMNIQFKIKENAQLLENGGQLPLILSDVHVSNGGEGDVSGTYDQDNGAIRVDYVPPQVRLSTYKGHESEAKVMVNVEADGTGSDIVSFLYAEGIQNADYFKNGGVRFEGDSLGEGDLFGGQFEISKNKPYTFCLVDAAGHRTVKTVFAMGDLDFSQLVDVTDWTEEINFILERKVPTDAQKLVADMNQDSLLNVIDPVLLANLIMEGNPETNHSPVAGSPLRDQLLTAGNDPVSLDITGAITDVDGDVLRYNVTSGNPGVVTASLTGKSLVLNPVSAGESVITLTAYDGNGEMTSTSFTVTVEPPTQMTLQVEDITVTKDRPFTLMTNVKGSVESDMRDKYVRFYASIPNLTAADVDLQPIPDMGTPEIIHDGIDGNPLLLAWGPQDGFRLGSNEAEYESASGLSLGFPVTVKKTGAYDVTYSLKSMDETILAEDTQAITVEPPTQLVLTSVDAVKNSGEPFDMEVKVKGTVESDFRHDKVRFYASVAGKTSQDVEFDSIVGIGDASVINDGLNGDPLLVAWGTSEGTELGASESAYESVDGVTLHVPVTVHRAGAFDVDYSLRTVEDPPETVTQGKSRVIIDAYADALAAVESAEQAVYNQDLSSEDRRQDGTDLYLIASHLVNQLQIVSNKDSLLSRLALVNYDIQRAIQAENSVKAFENTVSDDKNLVSGTADRMAANQAYTAIDYLDVSTATRASLDARAEKAKSFLTAADAAEVTVMALEQTVADDKNLLAGSLDRTAADAAVAAVSFSGTNTATQASLQNRVIVATSFLIKADALQANVEALKSAVSDDKDLTNGTADRMSANAALAFISNVGVTTATFSAISGDLEQATALLAKVDQAELLVAAFEYAVSADKDLSPGSANRTAADQALLAITFSGVNTATLNNLTARVTTAASFLTAADTANASVVAFEKAVADDKDLSDDSLWVAADSARANLRYDGTNPGTLTSLNNRVGAAQAILADAFAAERLVEALEAAVGPSKNLAPGTPDRLAAEAASAAIVYGPHLNQITKATLELRVEAAREKLIIHNQAPTVKQEINDQIKNVGDTFTIDLTTVFEDADGDTLEWLVNSSDPGVAAVLFADDNVVLVSPNAEGTATITLTAMDKSGATVTETFMVTVEGPPKILSGSINNDNTRIEITFDKDVYLLGENDGGAHDQLLLRIYYGGAIDEPIEFADGSARVENNKLIIEFPNPITNRVPFSVDEITISYLAPYDVDGDHDIDLDDVRDIWIAGIQDEFGNVVPDFSIPIPINGSGGIPG